MEEPTVPKILDEKTAAFVATCDKVISECEAVIADYVKRLGEAPSFALSSCDHLVSSGAELQVWRRVRDALTSEGSKATLASVLIHATREALHHAQHLSRSTSVTANLSYQSAGSAWAEVVDKMKWAGLVDPETLAFKGV